MPVEPLDTIGFFDNYDLENPDIAGYYADYRFFTTDILTNTILSEIPFKDVSWQRSIKAAGEFSGSIEVIPGNARSTGEFSDEAKNFDTGTDHLDLYNSTMPGKTAVYVVRNGICIWGGIIWSRTYDIISRKLQISASEFTSYLFHRVAWKTYKHEFVGSVLSDNGSCRITLQNYDEFQTIFPGALVKIIFYNVENFRYNGFYEVTSLLTQDSSVFSVTIPDLPSGTYDNTQIIIRADTYDYVKQLLNSTFLDFINLPFQNDEIEPARGVDSRITTSQISGEVATITTATEHTGIPGQTVAISNLNSNYNGQAIITEVPNNFTFRYQLPAGTPDVPQQLHAQVITNVTQKQLENYIVTLTTNINHGFEVGDTVDVEGVDDGQSTVAIFNGTVRVLSVPTPNSFTYYSAGIYDQPLQASSGSVTKTSIATIGTYGSFPLNSDPLVSYYAEENGVPVSFSGQGVESVRLRGHELRTIGEELDLYSDVLNGFEYRVDCDYDFEQATFFRTLVLLPIQLPELPRVTYTRPDGTQVNVSPIERFPGASEIIFEYPGNIDQFKMDESAEDAATRFFVSGNIPDLGNDVSQPYAAEYNEYFINQGWPLLDAVEDRNDVYVEDELYSYARRYLKEAQPPITKMTLSVNGSQFPQVGQYKPGDWCSVLINDVFFQERLQSPLEPRDDIMIRKIESIKVSVPNMPTFPEKVTLDLIPEWEVDDVQ